MNKLTKEDIKEVDKVLQLMAKQKINFDLLEKINKLKKDRLTSNIV